MSVAFLASPHQVVIGSSPTAATASRPSNRGFPSNSRTSANDCVASAGLALTCGALVARSRREARAAQAMRSRLVRQAGLGEERRLTIKIVKEMEEVIPRISKEWLDGIMKEDPTAVLLGGVEKFEAVPGKSSQQYIFFRPVDVGPYRAQVRLTAEVPPAEADRAEVKVLELNPGILDKDTGKVEYQEDPNTLVEAVTSVELRWQDGGSHVKVFQRAQQDFTLKMPWWFPVPDNAVEAVLKPFIERMLRESQAGVFRTLRKMAKDKNITTRQKTAA